MSATTLTEPSTWSIETIATPDGVVFIVKALAGGIELALPTTRANAREFARGVLAAAGDATERAFLKSPLSEG